MNDLYTVICYCQGLHPDPDLSGDDEEEIDDHLVAAMFGEQPSGVGELVIEEEENMEETGEGTHTCSHTAHLPHTDHMHLLWTLCHGLCKLYMLQL